MPKYQIFLILSVFLYISSKESNKLGFLADNEYIELEPPVTKGGKPLYQALAERRSQRSFVSGGELSLAELSQLLWAAYGPNRPDGLRTAPSCHGMLSLDHYVFLEKGVYKYLPTEQKLELVIKRDFRAITGLDDFVQNAPISVCFVGDLDKLSYIGDINGERQAVDDDSGHSCMNMLLYCSSANLKCVPRANINEAAILKILNLDSQHHHVSLCFSGGH